MSVQEKIRTNFFAHPLRFILRQIYRLLIIFPMHGIICLWQLVLRPYRKMGPDIHTSNVRASTQPVWFFITSVIDCSETGLTYAQHRSIFTVQERASQTIETIKSIRKQVPKAKICLLEAGVSDAPQEVTSLVDTHVYIGNRPLVRWACDSRYKSFGETMILLYGAWTLKKIQASLFFKISGRYVLDDMFRFDLWVGGEVGFYYIRPDFVSTRLYAFPPNRFDDWHIALWKGLFYTRLMDYPIEYTLPRYIPQQYIRRIERLGVSGADATCGVAIKE